MKLLDLCAGGSVWDSKVAGPPGVVSSSELSTLIGVGARFVLL